MEKKLVVKRGDKVRLIISDRGGYDTMFIEEHDRNNGIWEVTRDYNSGNSGWLHLKSLVKFSGEWTHDPNNDRNTVELVIDYFPDNLFEVKL